MQMCPFCDKVYDESEYSCCPYCSELEEDVKKFVHVLNVEDVYILMDMIVGNVLIRLFRRLNNTFNP